MLHLPRERPWLWILVLLLYPALSAYPQEVIFRAFFFRRYGPLFRTSTTVTVASAAWFSFAQIIMGAPLGVIATFPAGLAFATTYRRSDSLMLAAIEHAVWGNLASTLGLGATFYAAAARAAG